MSFVRSQSSTSITTQTSTGDDSVLFDDATSTEDDGRDYDPWSTPWSILDKNEDEKVNEFLNHMIPVPTMNSFNDPKELIAFVKIKISQINSFRAMKAYWWFDTALKKKLQVVFTQIDKTRNILSKYAAQCIRSEYFSSDGEKSDDSMHSLKRTNRNRPRPNVIPDSDDDSMECDLTPLKKPEIGRKIEDHKEACTKCKEIELNVCGVLSANKPSNYQRSRRQHKKDNNDYKLNPLRFEEAIRKIAAKLGVAPNSIMPGIDSYSTAQNYQALCYYYVTEENNFLSEQYNCKKLWNIAKAWANPPYGGGYPLKTLYAYKGRQVSGFICLPKYKTGDNECFQAAKKCCKAYVDLGGAYTDKNMYLPKFCDNKRGFKAPKFDTFVFYFDFRSDH